MAKRVLLTLLVILGVATAFLAVALLCIRFHNTIESSSTSDESFREDAYVEIGGIEQYL